VTDQKLTAKREVFAQGLAAGMSNADAYRKAFKADRMKEETIHQEASRLARDPQVTARVAELTKPVVEAIQTEGQRLFQELRRIALLDPKELLTPEGNLLPIHQMPEDARRAIAGLDIVETIIGEGDGLIRTKKVKLADKLRAIEMLGKYQEKWADRHEHAHKVTLEDLVSGSQE
jgi:hypothetical protein